MINFVFNVLKALGRQAALDVVIKVLKWLAKLTPQDWDDKLVAKLEEAYNLLKPFIPEKRR